MKERQGVGGGNEGSEGKTDEQDKRTNYSKFIYLFRIKTNLI